MTNSDQIIKAKHIYRHFKGKFYYVIGTALHTETNEEMVIYHPLYGDYQLFVRPLKMFTEEVPEDKENPTGQKYRFELVDNLSSVD